MRSRIRRCAASQIEVTDDQGEDVTSSLLALAEAGGIGLLLSVVVLFFFLRHWPSTLMVTLAIPICFVMTLGFMYFAGVTLNILSMMGLLLAVGMLVDNAVVVVESIYQEREKYPGKPRLASIVGTRHVAIALSAGTLCHCIVFLPKLFGETQHPHHLPVADRDHHLGVAAGLVAGGGQPDPDAVGADEDAAGGAQSQRADPAPAGALCRACCAGPWSIAAGAWPASSLISRSASCPMMLTKTEHVRRRRRSDEINIFYQWKGAYTKEQMSRGSAAGRAVPRCAPQATSTIDRRSTRCYSEQGWAPTRLSPRHRGRRAEQDRCPRRCARGCPSRRAPTSASAGQGGMGGGDRAEGAGSAWSAIPPRP